MNNTQDSRVAVNGSLPTDQLTNREPRPSRNWIFVINNPDTTGGGVDPLQWECKYLIYQRERGAEGTIHYQGYVMFREAKSRRTLKNTLSMTAHWEPAKSGPEYNITYCSKEDTRIAGPFEKGTRPLGQGKRTDLDVCREMIIQGKPEVQIADEHFQTWCKYFKAFERYRRLKIPFRDWQTTVEVYWGPPGSGKSSKAQRTYPGAYWLPQPKNNEVWWDGYEGQEVVVIDEFYGWLKHSFLCRLCDRYPLLVETKGGHVAFTARKIIITSNKPPTEWYKFGLGALERRFSAPIGEVTYIGYSDEFPEPEPLRIIGANLHGFEETGRKRRFVDIDPVEVLGHPHDIGRAMRPEAFVHDVLGVGMQAFHKELCAQQARKEKDGEEETDEGLREISLRHAGHVPVSLSYGKSPVNLLEHSQVPEESLPSFGGDCFGFGDQRP